MSLPDLALRCLMLVCLVAAAGCSRLVNAFVYFPERSLSGAPGAVGLAFEEVRFPAADGTELHGWWIPGRRAGPAVLFFHGNAGNISQRLDILRRLYDRVGLDVFAFDYRGYGRSDGSPSEEGLYADARGARALLRSRGWDKAGVLLYGRSLGAAVALDSAVEDPPEACVLEAAFTSLEDLARLHYPILSHLVRPWVQGAYPNIERIKGVRCPILFLHGDRDEVVPIGMGWQLFDACQAPKWFRTARGAGHDDPAFVGGESYWAGWESFLEELARRRGAAQLPPPQGP
jgi:fermentation-respiration switch protein FrsA (DUF1100 family)